MVINQISFMVADAEYYRSIAALKLFNPDAEYRMMMFIYTHPESPRINDARLELGQIIFIRTRTTGKLQLIMKL